MCGEHLITHNQQTDWNTTNRLKCIDIIWIQWNGDHLAQIKHNKTDKFSKNKQKPIKHNENLSFKFLIYSKNIKYGWGRTLFYVKSSWLFNKLMLEKLCLIISIASSDSKDTPCIVRSFFVLIVSNAFFTPKYSHLSTYRRSS